MLIVIPFGVVGEGVCSWRPAIVCQNHRQEAKRLLDEHPDISAVSAGCYADGCLSMSGGTFFRDGRKIAWRDWIPDRDKVRRSRVTIGKMVGKVYDLDSLAALGDLGPNFALRLFFRGTGEFRWHGLHYYMAYEPTCGWYAIGADVSVHGTITVPVKLSDLKTGSVAWTRTRGSDFSKTVSDSMITSFWWGLYRLFEHSNTIYCQVFLDENSSEVVNYRFVCRNLHKRYMELHTGYQNINFTTRVTELGDQFFGLPYLTSDKVHYEPMAALDRALDLYYPNATPEARLYRMGKRQLLDTCYGAIVKAVDIDGRAFA